LRIASVQSSDAGTYTAHVNNSVGSVSSVGATLTVSTGPGDMAFIPAGSFTMGDSLDGDAEAQPVHIVYVSAFYMDKYPVTLHAPRSTSAPR
jgi:formylglycine-generating enzyme required for sulfatase activity